MSAHDYGVARVMTIALTGGGVEKREACGCASIYREMVWRHYPCRGHGGAPYSTPADAPPPGARCACGTTHEVNS